MKTNRSVYKFILGMGAAFALAMAASPLLAASADEPMKPMKGGEMMMMKPITSSTNVVDLKDGDMVAMACPKCKTITVTHVNTEKGHIKTTTTGQEHLCPGCEQKFTVVGVGKGKHDVVTHVCKNCGSTDAFCCVMKKDGEPTKGMEKN
jgi:predicted RNA-binding Zn-ribbon protein involved in translation (DUF1610 family)